jgi:hypothetical protein
LWGSEQSAASFLCPFAHSASAARSLAKHVKTRPLLPWRRHSSRLSLPFCPAFLVACLVLGFGRRDMRRRARIAICLGSTLRKSSDAKRGAPDLGINIVWTLARSRRGPDGRIDAPPHRHSIRSKQQQETKRDRESTITHFVSRLICFLRYIEPDPIYPIPREFNCAESTPSPPSQASVCNNLWGSKSGLLMRSRAESWLRSSKKGPRSTHGPNDPVGLSFGPFHI